MAQYICGKNSVIEAIENHLPIKLIYLSKKENFDFGGITTVLKSNFELDKLFVGINHQGWIAELQEFNYHSLEDVIKDNPKKILVLDHIQDPHNFGAILRTANAAGVKHIIIPKDRSVKVTTSVLKVASGGQINLKIVRVNSLVSTIDSLKNKGFWIYSSAIDINAKSFEQIKFNIPLVLVVGNESTGVSKPILKMSDELVYIPMQGNVQSLNVSVATGILLFSLK